MPRSLSPSFHHLLPPLPTRVSRSFLLVDKSLDTNKKKNLYRKQEAVTFPQYEASVQTRQKHGTRRCYCYNEQGYEHRHAEFVRQYVLLEFVRFNECYGEARIFVRKIAFS